MRATFIRLWAAAVALIPCAQAVFGGEPFPYRAQVAAAETVLHSGPGEDYYATDRLPAGEILEVYNEAPGGWLAIRPPDQSYSWVFGRHVEVLDNGLGRINKSDVASRIGGLESEKREVIQVRLQENELVAIINHPNEGDGLWVKIKPPAGEFRWVQASDVEIVSKLVDPVLNRDTVPPMTNQATESRSSPPPLAEEPPQTDTASERAEAGREAPTDDGWSRQTDPVEPPIVPDDGPVGIPTTHQAAEQMDAPTPPPAVPLNDSGWVVAATYDAPVPSASDGSAGQSGRSSQVTATPLMDYPRPPARVAEDPRFKAPQRGDPGPVHAAMAPLSPHAQSQSSPVSLPPAANPQLPLVTDQAQPIMDGFSADFARKLTALEWQLSQTVADDRQMWHLETLERDAEALLTAAQTVAEREAAKHTLGKIDHFASIQRQFEQTATGPLTPEMSPSAIGLAPAVFGSVPSVTPVAPQPVTAPSVMPTPAAPPAYHQPASALASGLPPGPRGRTWRYDAEGILQPVRSSRPGAPQYALVDDAGRLVTFVTPTPDVDAQPFVGKRVGVVGRSVYLPDLGQSNLSAGRINPLAQPLIR
jgi:hypothetical protein